MANGTVKRLVREKGFGFILSEGQEYFFHRSSVESREGFEGLSEGDPVSFEVTSSAKGLRAERVRTV